MTILSNQPGNGRMIIHLVANDTITLATAKATPLAGNTNFSNDNVTAMSIVGVIWSGTWDVKRGSNTVLNLTGSGQWDLQNHGVSINISPTADIVASSTSGGTLILDVRKTGTVIL